MSGLFGKRHLAASRQLASFPGRVDSKNNTADRQLFNFVLLKKIGLGTRLADSLISTILAPLSVTITTRPINFHF